MPNSYYEYIKLWERFWANGNYPLNGELTKDDRQSIKKIFLKLNAEKAVRRYRNFIKKNKIENL